MPLQGASVRVLLSECCVCFGAWLLVPLQGATVRVLLSELQGATVRVLLSELFALWSLAGKVLQGAGAARSAAAGYCCRVL